VYRGSADTRRVDFSNGDVFEIRRLTPGEDDVWLSHSVFIPGKDIIISYTNEKQELESQTTTNNLPFKTLFIQTTECDAVISICGAYSEDDVFHTRFPLADKENPLSVRTTSSPEPGYVFSGGCSLKTGQSSQLWYILSRRKENLEPFFNFSNVYYVQSWCMNGMDDSRARLCTDGYYYEVLDNYLPSQDGTLFRMPACYAGVSFARYPTCRMVSEVGYAVLRLSASSQNKQGYWETGPYSVWLQSDFGIGAGFYDTRFNTEFASGLVDTYESYHDKDLLAAIINYTQYFIEHTQSCHITVGDGWLVRDYAPARRSMAYRPTHSSLNHQIAEIIYLNKLDKLLRSLSEDEQEIFMDCEFVKDPQIITGLSDKMLRGVENTANYWVMPDHNLNYAYGYNGSSFLPDYPYLTYNDLYDLNKQLKEMKGHTNQVLEYLMGEKKQWMDANGVTGYRE